MGYHRDWTAADDGPMILANSTVQYSKFVARQIINLLASEYLLYTYHGVECGMQLFWKMRETASIRFLKDSRELTLLISNKDFEKSAQIKRT